MQKSNDLEIMKQRHYLFSTFSPFYGTQEREKMLFAVIYAIIAIRENSDINIKGELARDGAVARVSTLCTLIDWVLGDNKDEIKILGKKNGKNRELLCEVVRFLTINYTGNRGIRYEKLVDEILKIVEQGNIDEIRCLIAGKMNNSDYYNNNSTSDNISRLALRILMGGNRKRIERILDACSSSGAFLSMYALNNDDKMTQYYGVDINPELCLTAKIRLTLMGVDFRIVNGDIFEDQLLLDTFDKIFCEMPFGIRLSGNTKIRMIRNNIDTLTPMTSPEWGYVVTVLKHLNFDGKMVTILPNVCLNSVKDAYVRKSLLRQGMVEAVIQLPAGAIGSLSVPVSIVVLSNGNKSVRLINGTKYCQVGRSRTDIDVEGIIKLYHGGDDSDDARTIDNNTAIDNNSVLLPERYGGEADILNHLPNPKLLGEISEEIFRGYQITANERKSMQAESKDRHIVRALTVSDIKNSIISRNLERLKDDDAKFSRYYLRDGDIVLSAKGDNVKIAVVEIKNDELIFANGSLNVVRLKEGYDPYYVCAYLNSEIGKIALSQLQTGSVIKSLNPSSLGEVKIPFLSNKTHQSILSENYCRNIHSINSLLEQAEELSGKNDALFNVIYNEKR